MGSKIDRWPIHLPFFPFQVFEAQKWNCIHNVGAIDPKCYDFRISFHVSFRTAYLIVFFFIVTYCFTYASLVVERLPLISYCLRTSHLMSHGVTHFVTHRTSHR